MNKRDLLRQLNWSDELIDNFMDVSGKIDYELPNIQFPKEESLQISSTSTNHLILHSKNKNKSHN